MTQVLLIDNGSRRAEAVINLRRLAHALSLRLGFPIDAVPLQHADAIPAEALNGTAAECLPTYLEKRTASGKRDFLLIPLFFGPSRALTSFVPSAFASIEESAGPIDYSVAPVLFNPAEPSHSLANILLQNLTSIDDTLQQATIVVDHGSPLPSVTAVRQALVKELKQTIHSPIYEAVMERREGAEYDFNGPLLADRLDELATQNPSLSVTIAMLFISPGRHAGDGGDIHEICREAEKAHPGLRISISPLVGDNPALIDLLEQRYHQAICTAPDTHD